MVKQATLAVDEYRIQQHLNARELIETREEIIKNELQVMALLYVSLHGGIRGCAL